MNERTKTGLDILKIAVILGVLADVLLRSTPWGLNVTLFNTAFAVGMLTLIWRRRPEFLTKQTLALFGALFFFASMFAWRDSIELRIADTFAIVAILSVLFLPKLKIATQIAGVFHYGVAFVWSAFNAAFAPFALLGVDIQWKSPERSGFSRNLIAVLRGVAIVAPILLIFGGLFVAADAVYEGWVQRVLNVRPEIVLTHVLLISLFSWMSAGYLRGVLIKKDETVEAATDADGAEKPADQSAGDLGITAAVVDPSTVLNNMSILEHINISDPPDAPPEEQTKETPKADEKRFEWKNLENSIMPPAFTLGTVEVGIILGLINLLFLSFVIVQVPYLFGGMDLVQNTPDFKLAEYARRGFGELVAVSAMVLPILLASHWLIRKENPFTEKLFRVLAGIQIALLFVIMASAVQRLILLTGNLGYGLTTIRLYPMILMTWLAIVFIWFAVTVLRGSRQFFAWGALWSAFLILGATHVLSPDEFIVKTNIALMRQGRQFDARYNSELSDAVVLPLLESLDVLNPDDRQIVLYDIGRRLCEKKVAVVDLRSWNFDRWNSVRQTESNSLFMGLLKECEDRDSLGVKPIFR